MRRGPISESALCRQVPYLAGRDCMSIISAWQSPGFRPRIEQVMRRPITLYGAVIPLDIGVLVRSPRLDERDLDAVLGSATLFRLA